MTINEYVKNVNDFNVKTDGFYELIAMVDNTEAEVVSSLVKLKIPPRYAIALIKKISNLLIAKKQFLLRHDYLVSSPLGIYIDPSNGCPLSCPGCLHNPSIIKQVQPDWPSGFLKEELYANFLDKYGPYMNMVFFFNWGEPLLNKKTPQFIKMAKKISFVDITF